MAIADSVFFLAFPPEEYQRRLDGARQGMRKAGRDALFVTAENTIRYPTGFQPHMWVRPTRPRLCVLPHQGDPLCMVPAANVPGVRSTSWVMDIRPWPAPRPDDDGVSLRINALGRAVLSGENIGPEISPEMRLRMLVQDFLRRSRPLADRQIGDAGPVVKQLRMARVAERSSVESGSLTSCVVLFAQVREHVTPGQTV